MRTLALLASSILAVAPAAAAAPCAGTVFLTIDTGHMEPAEAIADILDKHGVKATFFLANQPTKRGDGSLEPSWAPYWKRLVAAGHAFGSHTWRHWTFAGETAAGKIRYVKPGTTQGEVLDAAAEGRGELVALAMIAYGPERVLIAGEGVPPFVLREAAIRRGMARHAYEDDQLPELVLGEGLGFYDWARGGAAVAIRQVLR